MGYAPLQVYLLKSSHVEPGSLKEQSCLKEGIRVGPNTVILLDLEEGEI